MNEEIIASFICCGKCMVVVKLEHGTHVMPYEDWKWVYGKLHPELWTKDVKAKRNRKIS